MDIEKRIRMAAESILENEALRAGIDDSSASALLDWGVTCAKSITGETIDLEDDEEASEASYTRMRALREMLDIAKSLSTTKPDNTQKVSLLADLYEKARLVYGPGNPVQHSKEIQAVSTALENDTGYSITALRTLIEINFIHPQE
jgi:hypothetical protein